MAAALLLLLLAALPVRAIEPGEALDDPALEARARALSAELRCPVCQNESIDSSSAQVARDLRRTVRERLMAGDSDAEVLDFIFARYGDYVLMRPRLTPATVLLWGAPLVLLIVGGLAAWHVLRRPAPVSADRRLSDADRERLRDALDDDQPRA